MSMEALTELREEYTKLSRDFDPDRRSHDSLEARYLGLWCSMNRLMGKYGLYEFQED